MDELTENYTIHGPVEVHPLGGDLFAVIFTGSRNHPDAVPEPMVWRIAGADLVDLSAKIERARLLAKALQSAPASKTRN